MRACLPRARLSPTGTHSRPPCVQMSVSAAERQRCGTGNFTASFRSALELILSLVFFLWCLRVSPLIPLLEINGAKRLFFLFYSSLIRVLLREEMNAWCRTAFNHTQKRACPQLRGLFWFSSFIYLKVHTPIIAYDRSMNFHTPLLSFTQGCVRSLFASVLVFTNPPMRKCRPFSC